MFSLRSVSRNLLFANKVITRQARKTEYNTRQFILSAAAWNEKKLFTPGPLGVSMTVKEAMLRDLGSRDTEFIDIVKYIRSKVIDIAGVPSAQYTCIPMHGSGTFAVEAVFQTTVPRSGAKVLILENGAYGKRMGKMCAGMGVDVLVESFPEDSNMNIGRVEEILKADKTFTNVAVVHHETSSGVVNPIQEIGKLVSTYVPGATYLVDAMSSFGAMPVDIEACYIDYLVTSANKCLQGVPGFAIAIARVEHLLGSRGRSPSLCLDLVDQYENLESTFQFRFTPPTHTILAFKQALKEFDEEGGVMGRAARYKANNAVLKQGMKKRGFKQLLDDSHHGYIITSYHHPKDPKFDFNEFYKRLSNKGKIIYPGKVLKLNTFRIGNIGDLYPTDLDQLLSGIDQVFQDMGIKLPLQE